VAQERLGQRRRVAVFEEGLQVKAVHRLQVGAAGVIAMHHPETDALAGDLCPLLADVLATLVVHRGEELLERRPAARVLPLELDVLAQQPVVAEGLVVAGRMEIDVRRGHIEPGQLLAKR